MRTYKETNRESLKVYNREYQRNYYATHPEKYYYWQVRSRAQKLGIDFDLELSDIHIPDVCPILGIPLIRNVGRNGPSPNSPSLDRIIPSKGYTKGNVWVISQRANVMKNDATPEELKRFAAWINQSTL